jgi:hypothetical protein
MAEVDAGAVAPEVPVTPATEVAPVPDSTAEPVTEVEAKPEAPERTFTQKELDEIVQKEKARVERKAERKRLEADAERYKREAEELRARVNPQPSKQEGEPQAKDFADFESFNRAQIRWEIQQEMKAEREKSQRETGEQQQNRQFVEHAKRAQEKVSAAAKKYDDFQEVIDGGVFTAPMTAFITDVAKDGGELAYYLGTHRDEAIRIAQLPQAAQPVEMHLLESKLTAAPKPTQAPAPIVPNKASPSTEKRLEEAESQEEFNTIRRRQIAARKGAWK